MILEILNKIADEPGSNAKMDILNEYKHNEDLIKVLYLAESPRIKFWIKQIPEYNNTDINDSPITLNEAFGYIEKLSNREFTGLAASKWLMITLSHLTKDDAIVIERIIKKDLKIGIGKTNINKIIPNLIEVTPYMGAQPFDNEDSIKLTQKAVFSQVKMDGRYCNAIIEDGKVVLLSRQGEITYIGDSILIKELSKFNNCVLNGELTIDGVHRYEANGIVSSIVSIEGSKPERTEIETEKKIREFEQKHGSYSEAINSIKYTVWDTITLDEYKNGKSNVEYHLRLSDLQSELDRVNSKSIQLISGKEVNGIKEAMDHFQELLSSGEEGTIIKSINGLWVHGKPKWQMKMKKEDYHDLKIIGFNYGTPGTKNEHVISSLDVATSDDLLVTSPGGISEADMRYITDNQSQLLGKIVEVKCSGLSQNREGKYSLLHPVFIKIRDDKNIANSLTDCIKINEMINNLSNI